MNDNTLEIAKGKKKKDEHSFLGGVVGGSYFLLFYFAMLTEDHAVFYAQMAFSLFLGGWILLQNIRNIKAFVLWTVLIVLGQLIMVLRGFPSEMTSTYREFFYLLMGVVFCAWKMDTRILSVCYYIIAALIGVRLIQNFYLFFLVTEDNQMTFFAASSVNYISVLLLTLLGIIYYQARIQGENPSLLPTFVALVLSFLSKSRMGMVVTLLLLLLLLFVVGNKGKMSAKSFFLTILISLVSLVGLYIILSFAFDKLGMDGFSFLTDKFENRSSSYQEDARFQLLTGYLSGLNMESLFAGVDLSKIAIFAQLENTHNSLLYMHYHYGILAIVIICLLIKTTVFLYKRDLFLCIVFVLLLLRGFTDDVFFVKNFDTALFVYMLAPYFSPLFKKGNCLIDRKRNNVAVSANSVLK